MTKAQLEKKYGIRIVEEVCWRSSLKRNVKSYKMYSADGCPWENGLSSIKAVERECKEWESHLLKIKEQCKPKVEKRCCANCLHKKWHGWDGYEYCMQYEMEGDCAKMCDRYKYFDWVEKEREEREYCPSATNGDYGPSHPWDAPGCSISMFI